ncbi:hypothetical protein HYN59_00370 [Flavobacterium album]|uniref:Outer membrane protein beta-barrel domain-containing protein n=1 Tax=Flavobacterium album TaxID=2175091 RepID=A0A2S1QTU3_9FLAO|nr:porin family protein [Flavobacterium album]AWH83661.1 hypothetical protein HYN59_00370 [Flavobacterium album]
MKKLFFSALAVMAFGFAAQAQEDEFPIVGVKAGVNFSNFDSDADTDGATGFYAGISLDMALKGHFHFQPEMLYSKEGAKDQSISYLRIPAMAKYYITQGFNIQLGPVLGARVDAENKELRKGTKALDYGAAGGLSYELKSGFLIDARYYWGLEDISRHDEGGKVRNNCIQVGLGYRF